ncbi:zinc transporter ZIP1-like [Anthonomus grandis grandis]|uniref:zinc transporter ZIP1-like n=1 Tax=Anthonomus grandis grandis TaxID=2921223 RepID=UPI0021650B6E|nr:zinc transporter ZIP1-like [Anthonomus grandis grandis]
MDLPQSKFVALVTLGVGSILVGLLPACFSRHSRNRWPLFLSSLLCFGGGVLLSTSLVHILPEVKESVKKEYKPYAELMFCAGFFILYIMDEIVHFFYGEAAGHSHHNGQQSNHHFAFEGNGNLPRRHSAAPCKNYGATDRKCWETTSLVRGEKSFPYNPNVFRAQSDSVLFCDEAPSQLCHQMHQDTCEKSAPTASLGLLVALSIHSLLEGLVVGLEETPSKVMLLLGAIASHKLVVGFCLGVELTSNEFITFCKHLVCILVFAGSSVAGIVIGLFISRLPTEITNVSIPILQALAGGTLLYVTVCEILPRERARWHQQHPKREAGLIQLISVLAGFVTMTVLSKYLDG